MDAWQQKKLENCTSFKDLPTNRKLLRKRFSGVEDRPL
jgi:hypothetical protein